MILYQVIQPFQYSISADTVNDAIKSFAKIHRNLNLSQIIITDQTNHYEAKFKYFMEDGRNKVGIDAYPYVGPITLGPSYITWLDNPIPGVTGIPISPSMPASSIWSPTVPYVPVVSPVEYIPTIITLR